MYPPSFCKQRQIKRLKGYILNRSLEREELTEFERRSLDVLREPLENGSISLSRVAQKTVYPARFQLIAAMNPCPCGYLGDPKRACGRCTAEQIRRYQGKISGPVLDRIDMHIKVPALPASQLGKQHRPGTASEIIRQQVIDTRDIQLHRSQKTNSQLSGQELENIAFLDHKSRSLLLQSIDQLGLSARAYHRLLRLSRTIADLAEKPQIQIEHVAEALSYRQLDRQQL
jgi:magnesium chelatase family protein